MVQGGLKVGEERDGVCDDACFGGYVRRILQGGEPEAAVVAGQKMGVWDTGDGAVG